MYPCAYFSLAIKTDYRMYVRVLRTEVTYAANLWPMRTLDIMWSMLLNVGSEAGLDTSSKSGE